MKAHYRTTNGRITFEVEAAEPKALFRELASIQEVFDSEHICGVCRSARIRMQARKVEDFDFYELVCTKSECRARFAFGQAKKGGALFPKRKDEDGRWLPNGGWSRYEPEGAKAARTGEGGAAPAGRPMTDGWGITDADIPAAFGKGQR